MTFSSLISIFFFSKCTTVWNLTLSFLFNLYLFIESRAIQKPSSNLQIVANKKKTWVFVLVFLESRIFVIVNTDFSLLLRNALRPRLVFMSVRNALTHSDCRTSYGSSLSFFSGRIGLIFGVVSVGRETVVESSVWVLVFSSSSSRRSSSSSSPFLSFSSSDNSSCSVAPL